MKKTLLLIIILASYQLSLQSQNNPTELSVNLENYLSGFSNTSAISFWEETMFVVDQDGIIEMVQNDEALDDPFLDISNLVFFSGERGLLGLAFDPGFDTNRTFYVNYTNNSGNTVIASYKTFDDSLMGNPLSATVLLTMTQPYSNHNGGQIKFGPDGYLYIGMGDGGSGGDPDDRSQDPSEYMGKMLRLDVNADEYTIPSDNPFIDSTAYLDEIWSLGLRNPWRFSFDMETGDMWIGDVGQYTYEEVDFQPYDSEGGENWGWRCYEGFHPFNTSGCGSASDYDDPIYEYNHSGSNCSITGGYVYRGADSDLLNGVYLGIDYCSGFLFGLRLLESGELIEYENWGTFGFGYSTFGQDPEGEMYVAKTNGSIYKIVDPCHTQTPSIVSEGMVIYAEDGFSNYDWYLNDSYYTSTTSDSLIAAEGGEYYYIVENEFDCYVQSESIIVVIGSVDDKLASNNTIYPNPFTSTFSIENNSNDFNELTLYTMDGKQVFSQNLTEGINTFSLAFLEKGPYLIELITKKGITNTQLIIKD